MPQRQSPTRRFRLHLRPHPAAVAVVLLLLLPMLAGAAARVPRRVGAGPVEAVNPSTPLRGVSPEEGQTIPAAAERFTFTVDMGSVARERGEILIIFAGAASELERTIPELVRGVRDDDWMSVSRPFLRGEGPLLDIELTRKLHLLRGAGRGLPGLPEPRLLYWRAFIAHGDEQIISAETGMPKPMSFRMPATTAGWFLDLYASLARPIWLFVLAIALAWISAKLWDSLFNGAIEPGGRLIDRLTSHVLVAALPALSAYLLLFHPLASEDAEWVSGAIVSLFTDNAAYAHQVVPFAKPPTSRAFVERAIVEWAWPSAGWFTAVLAGMALESAILMWMTGHRRRFVAHWLTDMGVLCTTLAVWRAVFWLLCTNPITQLIQVFVLAIVFAVSLVVSAVSTFLLGILVVMPLYLPVAVLVGDMPPSGLFRLVLTAIVAIVAYYGWRRLRDAG